MIPTKTGDGAPRKSTGNSSTANRDGRENVRGKSEDPDAGELTSTSTRSSRGGSVLHPSRARLSPEERHARRLTSFDDIRPGEFQARACIDVEPVEMPGASGVGEIEQADHIVSLGRRTNVDQGVEARISPARRQAMASLVLEFEHRAKLRVEPLRPAFDHHALAGPGMEAVGIDVARGIDPSAERHVELDRLNRPSPFGSVSRRVVRGLTKKP